MKIFLVIFFLVVSNQIVFGGGGSLRGDIIDPAEEPRVLATFEEFSGLEVGVSESSPNFQRAPISHMERYDIAYRMALYLVAKLRAHYNSQLSDTTPSDWAPLLDAFAHRISTKGDMNDEGLTREVFEELVKLEGLLKQLQEDVTKLSRFYGDSYLTSPEGHLTERGMVELWRISFTLYHVVPELVSNFHRAFSGSPQVWSYTLSTYQDAQSVASMGARFHVTLPTVHISLSSNIFTSLIMHYADRILVIVDTIQRLPTMNFYVMSREAKGYVELHDVIYSPRDVFNQYGRASGSNRRLVESVRLQASPGARLKFKDWRTSFMDLIGLSGARETEARVGPRGNLLDVTVGDEGERSRVAAASGRAMRAEHVDRIVGEPRVGEPQSHDLKESRPARWLREARARISAHLRRTFR